MSPVYFGVPYYKKVKVSGLSAKDLEIAVENFEKILPEVPAIGTKIETRKTSAKHTEVKFTSHDSFFYYLVLSRGHIQVYLVRDPPSDEDFIEVSFSRT